MGEPGLTIFVATAVVMFGALLISMAEGFLNEKQKEEEQDEKENDSY